MTVFVDTSVWFAAAVAKDRSNAAAKAILRQTPRRVTSDHVLIETWFLLRHRYRRDVAERFLGAVCEGAAEIAFVTAADLDVARAIANRYPDQDFSIVDRTSFAVMERLGIVRAASFDADFAVYRIGPDKTRAFDIVRP